MPSSSPSPRAVLIAFTTLFVVALLAALGLTGSAHAEPDVARRVVQSATITRVVDGDTVDVLLANGRERSVRLVGIDSPETYAGPECGGQASTDALTRKLPLGTAVTLVSDPTQASVDRYDRLLRYVVRTADGRDMNRSQVRDGHATVYVYHHVPFQRTASYRGAQRKARAADRGLWGAC